GEGEVTSRPSERPGAPLGGDAKLHTGVDAGRNGNGHAVLLTADAAAGARLAHLVRRPPVRIARGARRKARHRELDARAARRIGEAELDGDVDILAAAPRGQRIRLRTEPVIQRTRVRID